MSEDASSITRRRMLGSTLAAAGGAVALTQCSSAPVAARRKIPKGGVVLFQGDSITDAGRNRKHAGPNHTGAFGGGYAYMIAAHLLGLRVGDSLRCYNRGISGDRVADLDARWQQDTIDLKPAVLSILIGVNDIWHNLNGNSGGSVDDYEKGLGALLETTRKALPGTRLVVCEPFVLRCGVVNDRWFPEFDERRAAAGRVAKQAGATWVPFQAMFDDVLKHAEPEHWAADGVHPSMAGHALMAKTWIDVVRP